MNTAQKSPSIRARHQVKGGIYLVVADETDEFMRALEYAGQMAKVNKCHVGILNVIEDQAFLHWGNIEKRMRQEQREEAETLLWAGAHKLHELGCKMPAFFVEKGNRPDVLTRIIEENPNITILILGGSTRGKSPGPLVSLFAGKGLSRLNVPVMIVPEHLDS